MRKVWRALPVDQVDDPTWSRHGDYIYYDTVAPSHALRRVRVTDGHIDQLFDLGGFSRAVSSWAGLTPNDEPLLLRSVGGQELYLLRLESR